MEGTDVERLQAWMEDRQVTIAQLAREIGMKYPAVYRAIRLKQRIPNSMKWYFFRRYGAEEALAIFGDMGPESGSE